MLKRLRREKHTTQKSLARLLGVPQSYVSKYELGERRIDFVETYEICRALNTDLREFANQYVRAIESRSRGRVAFTDGGHDPS
jgi:transcriptional regulator with XRE-family HTH domain